MHTPPKEDSKASIATHCPSCHRNLRVPDQFFGHLVRCRFCMAEFWLPDVQTGTRKKKCSGCEATLTIPRRFFGHYVQCKRCGHEFYLPPDPPTPKPK